MITLKIYSDKIETVDCNSVEEAILTARKFKKFGAWKAKYILDKKEFRIF
jgi:hypothetical protein